MIEIERSVFDFLVTTRGMKAWVNYKEKMNQFLRGEVEVACLGELVQEYFGSSSSVHLHNELVIAMLDAVEDASKLAMADDDGDRKGAERKKKKKKKNKKEEGNTDPEPSSRYELLEKLPAGEDVAVIQETLRKQWSLKKGNREHDALLHIVSSQLAHIGKEGMVV